MHTVVLLQGKCKSINVYRRAIYRRARRGGKLIKKSSLSLATSPLRYTHTMFGFPSFLFPGDLHDSLDILWQPLATCHQGEAVYIGGLWEGISPKKNNNKFFSLATSPPKGSHIYIYTHTLCLFFLLPFPWESSWLSGHSLATSEEVWQSVWISSNTITGIWA